MNATTNTIQQTAMLFTLNIKQWSAKASDKTASRNVASDNNASPDMVRLNKTLAAHQYLDDLKKIAGEARTRFYELSLPWMNDPRRIGSTKNYNKLMVEMGNFQTRYMKTVSLLEGIYPVLKDEAPTLLGALYKASDYPDSITDKYGFEFHCEPIPNVDDIRVGLGEGERAKIAAELKAQIEAALVNAKRDIYERAADCVKRIAEALPKFDPDAKGKERGTFRDSIIGNVADLLDGLDGLNFDNDQSVIALGDRLRSLTVYEPEALREDASKRAQVSSTAIEILEMMQGYTGMTAPVQGATLVHGQSAA